MEDVSLYTVYYSHYHVRAAEAAAVPPVPRKRQGVVCFFLALGALCGMATVAVGFVAHNSAIVWPVVAVGLIGVVTGLVLAHRQATGSWVWGCGSSSARAPGQAGVTSQAAAAGGWGTAAAGNGGGRTGGFQLPMYCADALDVEMGVVPNTPHSPMMLAAIKTSSPCGDCGDCGSSSGSSGSSSAGDSADAQKMAGAAAAASASSAAATAAEYGAVMCGFAVPGADGWIDTRPVLVLQPHPFVLLQRQTGHCDDGETAEASAPAALAAPPAPRPPSCQAAELPADPQHCDAEPLAAAAVEEPVSEQSPPSSQVDVLAPM